jgi:short subunit dehydrogenase-like uncharacterized protein
MTSKAERTYDIILWGATGFTGRLVAEQLARRCGVGKDLRWALAGRSAEKLAAVRNGLTSIDSGARELPLLLGDSTDRASLDAIVSSARTVVSTVGPYALHGRSLVASCVENGTDYCDLTGETHFVRAMIDAHHVRGRETGARIVHCCGFDSIPSDLGVLVLQTFAREQYGKPLDEVKFFMGEASGGLSGGTAASALNVFAEASHDPAIRRILANPYALDPDRSERGPDGPDPMGVGWNEDLRAWTGPFLMAAINTRIVRRSNALLGYPWGKDFRYSEVASFGPGAKGWLRAASFTAGFAGFAAFASLGPTRALLAKSLPAPGEGPSQERRERGFFVVRLVGKGTGTKGEPITLFAEIRAQGDPGYGATAKMLSEAALCLSKDDLQVAGGVLTPASCMGQRLVDRLRKVGMTFDLRG